jgi:simple sugar transport system ATP-binding protein
VDAAASADIRQRLIDLARQGAAVLVISQDLDELFEIADRIAVIHQGEVSGPRLTREVTREDIGLLMAGAQSRGEEVSHAS